MLTRFERIPTRNGKRPSTICGPLRIHCSDNGDTDGEVSAPEAVGTLSPSDRLNGEVVGQSVEATERSISAEDALRLVLDTTPALIHTGRLDGYLDYFNRRWLLFVGKPPEELCGWRWTDLVHPEDVARLGSEMAGCLSQRRTARSRSPRSTCGWRISVPAPPQGAAS